MEIGSIIRAYETLKSHGLDVSGLFNEGVSKESNRVKQGAATEVIAIKPNMDFPNSLVGNTGKQLNFLSDLIHHARSGDITPQIVTEKEKESRGEGEKRTQPCEVNRDHPKEAVKKKLEEYTITKLLMLKEDVDEIYGKGTFQASIGTEVGQTLGLPVFIPEEDDLDRQKEGSVCCELKNQNQDINTIKEVLKKGGLTQNGRGLSVRL